MKHILIASLMALFTITSPVMASDNPFTEITDANELLKVLKSESDKITNGFKGTKLKEKMH